jgi:hypothetical protein
MSALEELRAIGERRREAQSEIALLQGHLARLNGEALDIARRARDDGATVEDVADALGVSRARLYALVKRAA